MMATMKSKRGSLVEQAAHGDQRAFGQLLRAHDPQMRAFAYRILGSQAAMDDALQTAYLNAFRHIDSYQGDAPFAAWLRRIVVNCCRDIQRRTQRTNEVSLDQMTQAGQDLSEPSQFEEALVQGDELQRTLNALSPDQREAVILVNGQGLSYQEAAELCGVAEGTIGSRLSRAYELLRSELEQLQIPTQPERQPDAQPESRGF